MTANRPLAPDTLPAAPNLAGRIYGALFSYLFHPLFLPVYVCAFLLYLHPTAFTGFSSDGKRQTLLIVILNMVFFPLVSVLLLKALGFVKSIQLHDRKDRIIPYIASGIFFFWGYTVFRQQPQYPDSFTAFLLGVFLAASAALIANIYLKVSMHAIGMGGWLGFFCILAYQNSMLMTWPLAVVFLLTGAVCSARLLVSDHRPVEIYLGLAIGALCQIVAAAFTH